MRRPYQIPSLRVQGTLQKRRQEDLRARGDERHKDTRPSRPNRTEQHKNSQRLAQHAQSLHGAKPKRVPVLSAEADTNPVSNPEVISS